MNRKKEKYFVATIQIIEPILSLLSFIIQSHIFGSIAIMS